MELFIEMSLAGEANDNNNLNKNVADSKSFKYKTNITGSTYDVARRITDEDGNLADNPDYVANKRGTKEVEISVPLKYLGNFWNSFKYTISQLYLGL